MLKWVHELLRITLLINKEDYKNLLHQVHELLRITLLINANSAACA